MPVKSLSIDTPAPAADSSIRSEDRRAGSGTAEHLSGAPRTCEIGGGVLPAAKSYERRSDRRGLRDSVKPLKTLRLLSPARAVLTAVSALAAVLVLAAYLVTPPAERVSAQDGDGRRVELVVVPSVVEAGQTTLAVGFHVDPDGSGGGDRVQRALHP